MSFKPGVEQKISESDEDVNSELIRANGDDLIDDDKIIPTKT